MLNFLALMIAFGMLLWLIASVVVFTGGLAYYFFKDIFNLLVVKALIEAGPSPEESSP